MLFQIISLLLLTISVALCAPGGARQNMVRLARDNKPSPSRSSGGLDSLGGGNILRLVDPYTKEQMYRSNLLNNLDSFQSGEVLRMLDTITGGDFLSSLNAAERSAVVEALRKSQTKMYPKRMLDSIGGYGFGESKRNFDEIDNVGFTGFAKRSPHRNRGSLALAKKNFDEIDRAGFETYNKRNFDEIDNTGLDTWESKKD